MKISVCIATCRRPDRLLSLLNDLAQQKRLPYEVVVVDNDAAGSARESVRRARLTNMPFPIRYAIEPEQNVALARNRTVALARGSWLAFVDDDERAPATWLATLADAAENLGADIVLAPVEPVVPANAASWLRRGQFYQWPRLASGTVVPRHLMRFGNVLLNARVLSPHKPAFNPAYGLTGGEDGDLLTRLAQDGARIVWCDEAVVREPVEPARLSLRWLLLRAMRGGQDFARHVMAGRHGAPTATRRAGLFARSLGQLLAAGALAVLSLPLGRHHAVKWLTKASANLGKLSAFAGVHYREYAPREYAP